MSVARTQPESFCRLIPLHGRQEYQETFEITLDKVPPLSDDAVIADRTAYSIRYEDGLQVWYVDRFDKACIRAYRELRNDEDVEAGASPIVVYYNDGRGQL